MQNSEVLARIKEREEELAVAAELDAAWVLKQWRDIAIADPRELTALLVKPCPRCWPDGLSLEEPNPLCDAPIIDKETGINFGGCGGHGKVSVHLADTRKLSGPARRLFAGVKETKNGIEIKMRDQDAALANISRYLGMVVERKELSGPGGSPIAMATVDVNDLTDDQLAALIAGENTPQNVIKGGTIEGTLQLADSN